MIGPAGGTYIGPPDATPTTASGTTDSAGNVSVILNAGVVPGPATITATVTSSAGTFSASSSVISIGGAVPSASHFSFVAVRHNLPGLVKVGFTTNVSAFIGDRFSNYNLLAGTQVSFFTEAGAVDTSQPLDATGVATAVFRTQAPDPSPLGLPGIVTVIAVVRGEEGFTDVNGNGVFDVGEPLSDAGEPYIDANENGVYDVGEFFVDTNSNGVYDGPNGVWDGPGCQQAGCNPSPLIWQAQRMVFTGNITTCSFFPAAINVPNGGSQTFTATVADFNGNAPGPGTSVSFSATGGTLQGATSVTVPDIVGGPFTASITLLDAAPTGSPTPGAITMTVNSTEVVACPPVTINGIVN
jgi:adhesin/invasin